MPSRAIEAAMEQAASDVSSRIPSIQLDGRPRRRRLAIGDPQAPLAQFLEILDRHALLGGNGRLLPDVQLVSMGDHFDWGGRPQREKAAEDGRRLLSWLAAHTPDQVTLLLGNHDLARVGELARFDDTSFERARSEAELIYGNGRAEPDALREARFRERYPDLPSTEIAARDFSSFSVSQRVLVETLLRTRRFHAALAASDRLLLCHGGVTRDELVALDVPETSRSAAPEVAAALDEALRAAVKAWDGRSSLSIPYLHRPGDAASGEGRGIFHHRPHNPANGDARDFEGPPRRCFDPRLLPPRLLQGIGHIRDGKSRQLLAGWHDGAAAADGPLRHLATDGHAVRYARGVPARWEEQAAGIIFLDGGMNHTPAAQYELLDLDAGRAASYARL